MSDNIIGHQPKTLGVPEAGRRYFGLGRNASYAAAKRGDIPTIRLGRLLRAPVVALEQMLEAVAQTAATARVAESQRGPGSRPAGRRRRRAPQRYHD